MNSRRPAQRAKHAGFTLVELLVVIAIIGVLVSLLLPAIQSSREASRRSACANNLRQIALAAQNYVTAQTSFPAGSVSRESPDSPFSPWTFYRWSALATLTPYLEGAAVYDTLDLEKPLYSGSSFDVTPENREGVAAVIDVFLCPSDAAARVTERFGPTNYAVNAGSGGDGSPIDTDGVFFVNSQTRPADIEDGLSNTVLASESILGAPGDAPHDVRVEYKFVQASPLTEARCEASASWNVTDPRGFAWANGEFRCALYNHYETPNSGTADCMGVAFGGGLERLFTPYGWRAARSNHPGGVNAALADGAVRYTSDSIDREVWRGLSTVAGGELPADL
ncbi:MAG: DUF1559 domain-containing protein [Planctomycetota bacterium]